MKDFLYLFTPVEEGLPEETKFYFTYDKNTDHFDCNLFATVREKFMGNDITHWLNFESLTTKKRAEKLANMVGNSVLISNSTKGDLRNSNQVAGFVDQIKGEYL